MASRHDTEAATTSHDRSPPWLLDLVATEGRSDLELERRVAAVDPDHFLSVLAGHWSSVLCDADRVGDVAPTLLWRLTLPDGFYTLRLSSATAPAMDGAFPGVPPGGTDLSYQWYVLGLLRVMSGEHDMDHAFGRRWVAVSGDTAIWRELRRCRIKGPSLEDQLHRWPVSARGGDG